MRRRLLFVVALFGILVAARLSLFTVDRTEFAYVTQFGRRVASYDGAASGEAGLHVKLPWPIQSVQRFDRRLQSFDLPGAELLTHDPKGQTIDKTLTVDAYVCWSIADVDTFLRTVGTPERARTILGQRISSTLGAAIGQMELEDLVSVEPARVDGRREALRRRLLEGDGRGLQTRAREDYGIELVDVRLRRLNHPPSVREAIFERIRSEREKKVADYRSDGEKQARDIRSTAERKEREVLALAKADEQRRKGEADAEADRIRGAAHAKDPQFYAFLKKLDEYQRLLGDGKSVLLLSLHRELFDLLLKPPRPEGSPPRTAATEPSTPSAPKTGGP